MQDFVRGNRNDAKDKLNLSCLEKLKKHCGKISMTVGTCPTSSEDRLEKHIGIYPISVLQIDRQKTKINR